MTKTALVTGASSDIGVETVKGLLAAGYNVYAGAQRVDVMHLADAGAHVLALDVTDDTSMTAAVETLLRKSGRIDVLVNNPGGGLYGALEDVPLEEGRRQFDVNIFGLARLIQLVLPTMRAQWSGRIVNVSCNGGQFGGPFGSWSHASKFAVEGLSDSLRMELHPFDIDVVLIQPGGMLSEASKTARDGLMKHSGRGAYGSGARSAIQMMTSADQGSIPSQASVVAKTIVQAAQARNPRRRYASGAGAKLSVFLRRVLSDRAFNATLRLFQRKAIRSRA